jgi:hypothetical protein
VDTLTHYADYYRLHVKDDPIANLKMVEVEEDDILEYMVRLSASELKDKSGRKMGGTRKFVLVVSFLRTAFNAYHKKYKRQGNAFQYVEKPKNLSGNKAGMDRDKISPKNNRVGELHQGLIGACKKVCVNGHRPVKYRREKLRPDMRRKRRTSGIWYWTRSTLRV